MPVRAAFFDAGNTLLALDYDVIGEAIREAGHPVSAAQVRRAEYHARVRLDPHLAAGRSTEATDVFALYLRYLLAHLGIPWEGAVTRLPAVLRAAKRPWGVWSVPVPGAPAVLGRLRARGLRLAVVSNSDGTVANLLRAVGFADHLDAIVDSAVVGVEKPDPRIFLHAAGALGVRPEEAVHVGDLYSVDVQGARAAGCQAVLLDPGGTWPALDCPKVPDLDAAARLIETLAG